MKRIKLWGAVCAVALLCAPALPNQAVEWAPDARTNAVLPQLTRTELYAVLDQYLAALKASDPTKVSWAPKVRNTENNVAILVGDGLWQTLSGMGDYDFRIVDTKLGQIGFFGVVSETQETSAFALRLKIDDQKRVAEVETLVLRQLNQGIRFENQKFERQPVMNELLPLEKRASRQRMISLANGYFDTLQLNDGQLFTKFSPTCKRIENGVQTTNNPNFAVVPVSRLGCEEQFRMGNYRYDTRLRARRFPLVDEERGIVLAMGFIDHSGALQEYKLTDGTAVKSPLTRPHSFYLFEAFKIKEGAIEQIESVFMSVPYNMPSPWNDWGIGQ
jgi:hypothetical protein